MIVHPGPQFSVHDVFIGWQEALIERGIKTEEYNLHDRIAFYESSYVYTGRHNDAGDAQFKKAITKKETVIGMASNGLMSACYQFWPDVLIVVSAFFIPSRTLDIIRSRGTKVVILFTESPYEEPRQLKRARGHCDLALLNDPDRIADYDAAGIPAAYMPHAYRPGVHHPAPPKDDLVTDFAFLGTGFPTRVRFFERMIELGAFDGIDVTIGGNWQAVRADSPVLKYISHDLEECVDNELTTRVYQAAKAGMNLYRAETSDQVKAGWAMGPREVEMAACGLFFLRDSRPESDEVFPMLPTFASPEDAAEQLRWWLAHDTEREQAASQARAAIRDRTFANNVTKLLSLLDEL